ncbi:MAG: helix-turn-helix domain-containing protein [Pseudomonadota bacterium]
MPLDLAEITPCDAADRRSLAGPGMATEIVRSRGRRPLEIGFSGPCHLLMLRGHSFTFVPSGRAFRAASRAEPQPLTLFYLDPAMQPMRAEPMSWPPGSFEDAGLLVTAHKLEALAEAAPPVDQRYVDALCRVLWLEQQGLAEEAPRQGGLAGWQCRAVTAHIEAHLAERIPLDDLAALARLSRHHFCRAFHQSFGMPPHRYHNDRRIERAKALLAGGMASVTEIGLALGFRETSAFTATFHRVAGTTPSAWRRGRPWAPADRLADQLAVMPPSITSSVPVTHEESSDAR